MQALANELNLAETVFLGTATESGHYPMRIFTPTRELPFAGHPTVGTAHLLAELNLVNRAEDVVLTPPIGELVVSYKQGRATFTTAQPAKVMDSTIDHATAAKLLGLERHQVMGSPVLSTFGLPFHLIELVDHDEQRTAGLPIRDRAIRQRSHPDQQPYVLHARQYLRRPGHRQRCRRVNRLFGITPTKCLGVHDSSGC